jgi:hypothetical protein
VKEKEALECFSWVTLKILAISSKSFSRTITTRKANQPIVLGILTVERLGL